MLPEQQNSVENENSEENITYSPELPLLFDIWHRAADLNDVNAQFHLACCFVKSKQKSTQKKAFAFFKKLANQEYTTVQTNAQYMLAQCYENGYGITKSYPQAGKWYKKVRINANNDVYKAFEVEINKVIEATLDEPDHDEITHEIVGCVTESAEGGDVDLQKYLMELYQFGEGSIEPNYEEYAYWAEKAAENGDTEAMCKIGTMYYDGRGVKQNYKKALYWLHKAAAQGEADAAFLIGCYYNSQKQYKTAAKWYRICAELSIKRRNKKLSREMDPLTPSNLLNNIG